MKQLYEKIPVVHVPLEEETVVVATTTPEELMTSEYRTMVIRRLSTRQQMFFVLREMGYRDHEIARNFKMTMQALYNLRHRVRRVCKEIIENGYN